MKVGAIIAAAGAGRRMRSERPKQLLVLDGTPILIHTVAKFDASSVVDYIIVTAPKEAFERARKDEYYGTDESSLVERLNHPVAIVRGSERNIKITRPTDLTLARAFLEEEKTTQ